MCAIPKENAEAIFTRAEQIAPAMPWYSGGCVEVKNMVDTIKMRSIPRVMQIIDEPMKFQ